MERVGDGLAGVDARRFDARAPDGARPDVPSRDARLPDVAPDAPWSDRRAPDVATPDARTPDARTPDTDPPDEGPPDGPLPDARADGSLPDVAPDGPPPCVPANPPFERCDRVDDDCDGRVDEDVPPEGCYSGSPETLLAGGVCRSGQRACVAGERGVCEGEVAPSDERCNGLDDDCDGRSDEGVEVCAECATGRSGVCSVGRTLCVDGDPRCVPWLSPADARRPCDLNDDDCDGAVDEAGDASGPDDDVLAMAALADEACGVRPVEALDPDCLDDPWAAGCSGALACVEPGCHAACAVDRAAGRGAYERCLRACAPRDEGVVRWRCDDGPVCEPVCARGFGAEGAVCLPREVCNNGVDDDADGLVDGTLVGPDPCAATFDDDEAQPLGFCSEAAVEADPEGCGFSVAHPVGNREPDEGCSDQCPHDVQLTYAYSLDREEVSLRAYHACVVAGCCSEPAGRLFDQVAALLDADAPPLRPLDPPLVTRPPDPRDPAAADLLPDLPVNNVTWCQARDFCAWAGKRLPTEFEWERAAAGSRDRRRHYPWGPERLPACAEDQRCRAPGFEDDALPVCRGEIPEETRAASVANYSRGHPDCDPTYEGPMPVWSNADGATADGLLNIAGNVAEWVFDWYGGAYDPLARLDPVGRGCDRPPAPGRRIVRSEQYTASSRRLRVLNRTSHFPAMQVPLVGFRCARTRSDDDQICDPQTPHIRPACRPPPARPACSAPDFENLDARDVAGCAGIRQPTVSCSLGLGQFCGVDDPPLGCHAYIVQRLRVPDIAIQALGLSEDAVAIVNAVFGSTLAPGGGETYLALDLGADFGIRSRVTVAAFGSAYADNRRLQWLGAQEDGGCGARAIHYFPMQAASDCGGDAGCGRVIDVRPVCRVPNAAPADITMRTAPVSLRISTLSMSVSSFEPGRGRLSGRIFFFVNRRDAGQSTVGAPDYFSDQYFRDDLRAQPDNLCDAPLHLFVDPGCPDEGPDLPGCSDGQCMDPATCSGWLLAFDFDAIRADAATREGLLPDLVGACGDVEP